MSSIAAIASPSSQIMQQVQMKVAAKSLDNARQQGDAAMKLLQAAAEVQQQQLDTGSGKGQHINVVA